jgi:hypothetical protein
VAWAWGVHQVLGLLMWCADAHTGVAYINLLLLVTFWAGFLPYH